MFMNKSWVNLTESLGESWNLQLGQFFSNFLHLHQMNYPLNPERSSSILLFEYLEKAQWGEI
jgi:hypothetical protein